MTMAVAERTTAAMPFVTVVSNIIVEAVSAVVDIVLDVIDGGFFDDSVAD